VVWDASHVDQAFFGLDYLPLFIPLIMMYSPIKITNISMLGINP